MPEISVIIPTHNRAALLADHLRALHAQTAPRASVEWIIVCDGCSDGSARVAREAGADVVIEQPASGPAAARNAGLRAATGGLACFIDDDIIPDAGWVEAFAAAAPAPAGQTLYLGYCPHAPKTITTHLDRRNAAWYEGRIDVIRQPGYEPRYTDFFSGNFAVPRREFLALGGFDDRFSVAEDYEMAFRALQSGWRIRFVPAARAEHHFHRDARAYGRQAYLAGKGDALLVRTHPEMTSEVRIGLPRPPLRRIAGLGWRAVAIHAALSLKLVEALASVGERAHTRRLLDLLYALLWDGQYWRGVAAA